MRESRKEEALRRQERGKKWQEPQVMLGQYTPLCGKENSMKSSGVNMYGYMLMMESLAAPHA